MKAVCYSTKKIEKSSLVSANNKRHEITYISNSLCLDTVKYAKGKEAVLVFSADDLSEKVLDQLHKLGIRYIATRSSGTDHIELHKAADFGMKVANVPKYAPHSISEMALLHMLSLNRKVFSTVAQHQDFNFQVDDLVGTSLYKKTVGVIGTGNIGEAMIHMLLGMGCQVLANDLIPKLSIQALPGVQYVNQETLLANSDIITLHLPYSSSSHHLINKESIAKMKKGVMLINTARGALVNTADVIDALNTKHMAAFGLDVYEFEKGLFFEDHSTDRTKDKMMRDLISRENVLVTGHQGFLTKEALEAIALGTINSLDNWDSGKDADNEIHVEKTEVKIKKVSKAK